MSDLIELGEPDVIRNDDNILWLRAEIERQRAHIEWIGANTDSPSTSLYCHAALENDYE